MENIEGYKKCPSRFSPVRLVRSFSLFDEDSDKYAKIIALSVAVTLLRRDGPACSSRHIYGDITMLTHT
jgi:hypothetical protein